MMILSLIGPVVGEQDNQGEYDHYHSLMVVITVLMKVTVLMEVMMMGPVVVVHAEFLNLNC